MRRITRAWEPIPLSRIGNDLSLGLFPALCGAVAAYYYAPEDADTMTAIILPMVWFFAGLLSVLVVREIVPFLIRVARGKPAKGRPRSLSRLDTTGIEAQLRTENLSQLNTVSFTNDAEEEEQFATELNAILERGGCFVSNIYQGGMTGLRKPKDVLIYLPDGGSPGLIQLHGLLIRAGYKSTTEEMGRIQACAIVVGPPTH